MANTLYFFEKNFEKKNLRKKCEQTLVRIIEYKNCFIEWSVFHWLFLILNFKKFKKSKNLINFFFPFLPSLNELRFPWYDTLLILFDSFFSFSSVNYFPLVVVVVVIIVL